MLSGSATALKVVNPGDLSASEMKYQGKVIFAPNSTDYFLLDSGEYQAAEGKAYKL